MASSDFDPSVLAPLGFPHEPEIGRIVGDFFSQLPARIRERHSGLPAPEAPDFASHVHRLRGAAASLGFLRLETALATPAPPRQWKRQVLRSAVRARRAYRRAANAASAGAGGPHPEREIARDLDLPGGP